MPILGPDGNVIETPEANEEFQRKHVEAVRGFAQQILNSKPKNPSELRMEILRLYNQQIAQHKVEIAANPQTIIGYFLASLEVYHVCLETIWRNLYGINLKAGTHHKVGNENTMAEDKNSHGKDSNGSVTSEAKQEGVATVDDSNNEKNNDEVIH